MHPIEQKIHEFLEQLAIGAIQVDTNLYTEFAERCEAALRKHVAELNEAEGFTLRMSNIGKPLRQLMLEKLYGRSKPSADFVLKMLDGSYHEAKMVFLLRAAGCDITALDEQVSLELGGITINGTLDIQIGDKVYDIKSASPYSYDNKFKTWDSLAISDDFGYMGQGFGYATAKGAKFGGWIVINKVNGAFKVIDIPDDLHDELQVKYLADMDTKIKHVLSDKEPPACTGVVEEKYYKKPSGNKILGPSCRFCDHKKKCHPNIQLLPSKVSKSDSTKYVWYIEVKEDAECSE